MTDLIMAILHHILVFGLVAMMVVARTLLSAPPIDIPRLARLDMATGMLSGLVLLAGLARVFWGGKGWAFYEANPFFWTKIGCFALIGLISIGPTVAILRWSKACKANPAFQPEAADVSKVRMLTGLMALLLIPLLASAAAMARWPF